MAFVSFILPVKYLGKQLSEGYNYAFALAALFIPLCNIGMHVRLMREVLPFQAKEVAKQPGAVHSWKGMLTFLVTVLISFTTGILDNSETDRFSMVVLADLTTLLRT